MPQVEDDEYTNLMGDVDSNKFTTQSDYDDTGEKVERLMKVLQRLPTSLANKKTKGLYDSPSQFEGFLYRRNTGVSVNDKWNKYWCKLVGHNLFYYKKQESKKPKGAIPIAFCNVDRLDFTKEDMQNLSDEYINSVESKLQSCRFRIYSTRQIFFFQTDSEESLQEWVQHITRNLDEELGEDELEAKTIAAKTLDPLLKIQMQDQFKKLKHIMKLLEMSGMASITSPLASANKEKEGYLQIMKKDGIDGDQRWKRYYFVLTDGCLYYYKSSQDDGPSGVVSLKHAQINLSSSSIQKGKFVFTVKTAFRSMFLRAKHEAAMHSWLSEIDASRLKHGIKESGGKQRKSLVLQLSSFKVTRDWTDVNDVLTDRRGRDMFKRHLMDCDEMAIFKFQRDASDFCKVAMDTEGDLSDRAINLFDRYIQSDGERYCKILAPLRDEIRKSIDDSDWETCFSTASEMALQFLREEMMPSFVDSKYFKMLEMSSKDPEELAEPLVGPKFLVVEYQESKAYYELALGSSTIGRDSTNTVVLEDGRTSRVHCRIDVNDNDCCIISDLGSSRGTKVNGNRVIKYGLRMYDQIQVGETLMVLTNQRPECKKGKVTKQNKK